MIKHGIVKGIKEIVEVTCDMCGESCDRGPMWLDPKEIRKEKVCKLLKKKYVRSFEHRHFEYINIDNSWGYCSNKDTERWRAQICDKCSDELSKTINFKKTNYM